MTMNWDNLVEDLLINIVLRLNWIEDYYRFSAVCKSWYPAAIQVSKNPWLLPTSKSTPMLLLAEEVAPGSIRYDTQYYDDFSQDYRNTNDLEIPNYNDIIYGCSDYDYLKNSIGTSRGLYSLSSKKTYNIELPEAAGRLILGTNKGWLVTLGRDFQINLLHPLLRLQFSLPTMLTFPIQLDDDDFEEGRYTREDSTEQFITKVAISSNLLNKNTEFSLFHHHATPSPIVMAVYPESSINLGFARLGDKVWTQISFPSHPPFHDMVYHKGNFYVVDCGGGVYVCCIDDGTETGGPRGVRIASLGVPDCDQMYLVEPLSGSGLLLLVRYSNVQHFYEGRCLRSKYRTTHFAVWRLDLNFNESPEIPTWSTFTKVSNLGNEAIFVGRASSFSVSSSEIIKPNSIYFTDDSEHYIRQGGGHDMGIFDMERRTIEPHFQGKSIHCISPPLWYI